MSHVDSSSTSGKVVKAKREQWKNSSKQLLDGGQCKKVSTSGKGRLKKPARKLKKKTTANAPSGKSQKEHLEEKRQ